jgi:hypothetical protein
VSKQAYNGNADKKTINPLKPKDLFMVTSLIIVNGQVAV